MKVHVVMIGTAGNQRYIFASNKRRENVGASHLITRVEKAWLDAALRRVGSEVGRDGRIQTHPVEIVTANAGGITALVRDRDTGRELVREVTRLALRDAPGLDVRGVVGDPVEWEDAASLAAAVRCTRRMLPTVQMARPGPQLRFPGVPIIARCGSSGLPAWGMWPSAKDRRTESGPASARAGVTAAVREEEQPGPRSASSIAKLDVFQDALTRLVDEMGIASAEQGASRRDQARTALREVVDHLAERAEWVAVVHADGNAMGQVFHAYDEMMGEQGRANAREYVDGLRELSKGIDDCARAAFRNVVRELKTPCPECTETRGGAPGDRGVIGCRVTVDGEPPVLPLVLGGDDLTVLCDGAVALPFAERYLGEFARLTGEDSRVGGWRKQGDPPGLGACAGVAIVKRHYPFHSAAALAEELTTEAKRVKGKLGRDRCALSFHVLYESATADLDRLRGVGPLNGTRLTAQPYVVNTNRIDIDGGGAQQPNEPGQKTTSGKANGHRQPQSADAAIDWARGRDWTDLRRRVTALTRTNGEGERGLPGGQAHDLRSGLFLGPEVAEARFSLLLGRLGERAVKADLAGPDGSLFWSDGEMTITGLLDAMDAAPFLTGHDLRQPGDGETRPSHGDRPLGDGETRTEVRS